MSKSLVKIVAVWVVVGPSFLASANDGIDDTANHAWQAGANRHARAMAAYPDADSGEQRTPPVIRSFESAFDPSGLVATLQPSGPTQTSQNAFFENLGTNDRTCFTCHQPQNGWTVSAASVQARFYVSDGSDPIFRLVDGATCPSDDVSSTDAKLGAYSLLLQKGLFPIGLTVPPSASSGCCCQRPVQLHDESEHGPDQHGSVKCDRRSRVGVSTTLAVNKLWDF